MSERRLSKPLAFRKTAQSGSENRDNDNTELSLREDNNSFSANSHAEISRDEHQIKIEGKSRKGQDAKMSKNKNPFQYFKSIDANRYATKKTLAQGMLDIALLTTNASQLKYVLQVGERHEFYTPMLYLIGTSIGLQIIQGIICVFLGSGLNINKEQDQKRANWWNDICMSLMVLTVAVNVIISVFEMRDIDMLLDSTQNKTPKENSPRMPRVR